MGDSEKPSHMDLSALRENYTQKGLRRSELDSDPLIQFQIWFKEAQNHQLLEPNAMSLATANKSGQPSIRTVLLKKVTEQGFIFYTNYESRKGQDIEENPLAALLFTWIPLERQIRIEGKIRKVSREESEAYFGSRPKGSRIGAWASDQSKVIANREELEKRFHDAEARYEGPDVPAPDFWGGYELIATQFEFWQGRQNRMHDRLSFCLEDEKWVIERLMP